MLTAIVVGLNVEVFLHLRPTMSFILHPWQVLLLILAGWVNQQQQQVTDYLRTEHEVLKEKLGNQVWVRGRESFVL